MSLLDPLPSEVAAAVMRGLAETIAELVANPGRTAARLKEIADRTDEARNTIAAAAKATKELAAAREAQAKELAAERAAHDEKLLRERQGLERERAQFAKDRGGLMNEATKLRDQAAADAGKAAELKAAAQRKLQAFEAA
jgi:hypothetical protein